MSNHEKTLLIDALKHSNTLSELFAEFYLAHSSYFYHCSRLRSDFSPCMPEQQAQALAQRWLKYNASSYRVVR